jgi:hypothetical protein
MLTSNTPIQQTIKLHVLSHRQALEIFRLVNKKALVNTFATIFFVWQYTNLINQYCVTPNDDES